LLAAVVASEEALLAHMASCCLCLAGKHDICLGHTDFVMASAEAMLDAKVYLDVTEPDCDLSVVEMSGHEGAVL